MPKSEFLVTNAALFEKRATALLHERFSSIQKFVHPVPLNAPHPSLVPIVPSGAMRHNELYQSGKLDNAPFFLPKFGLQYGAGSPNIFLKRNEDIGDPTLPVGTLDIRLTRQPWIDLKTKAFAVDHQITANIGYHIPIEDKGWPLSLEPDHFENFEDDFTAIDPSAQGITWITATMAGNNVFKISAHIRDGGKTRKLPTSFGTLHDGILNVSFLEEDKTHTLRLGVEGAYLRVSEYTHFHTIGTAKDNVREHLFMRKRVGIPGPLSLIKLTPFVKLAEDQYRSVTDISNAEEYVRIWHVLTDPKHGSRLQIQQDVLVGRRQLKTQFIGMGLKEKFEKMELSAVALDRKMTTIKASSSLSSAASRMLLDTIVSVKPRVDSPVRHVLPVTARVSDITSELKIAGTIVVPVEKDGKPALTLRHEVSQDIIGPFWFDARRLAERFDAPDSFDGTLKLMRHEIQANGRTAIFYQDALSPNQVTYEPELFQLARSNEAPFEPQLLFFLEEDEDAGTDIPSFNVTMTYHARPLLDPALLVAAQNAFGPNARIAPLAPTVSRLVLTLPALRASAETDIERPNVEVDFADGLTDSVSLTEAQYHQLIAGFQTVGGTGMSGHVDLTLPDGNTAQVPVEISLRDAVGSVVTSHVTQTQSDEVSVTMRNQIESPISITNFPEVDLNVTRAQSVNPDVGQTLAAGDSLTLPYRLVPAATIPVDAKILPDVVVTPDILAILSQTTIVQGYADQEFEIEVSIDPLFFEFAPQGMEVLSGVEVRFRTLDEAIILTPAQVSQTVSLLMPKLLFLTSADAAQHYSFSVTNLHASGAGLSSVYTAGQGNLNIQPAQSVL